MEWRNRDNGQIKNKDNIKILHWRNQDNGQVKNEAGIIYALLSCPDTV